MDPRCHEHYHSCAGSQASLRSDLLSMQSGQALLKVPSAAVLKNYASVSRKGCTSVPALSELYQYILDK
jgi:hypothetical protein